MNKKLPREEGTLAKRKSRHMNQAFDGNAVSLVELKLSSDM